jgi:hypothetical protein
LGICCFAGARRAGVLRSSSRCAMPEVGAGARQCADAVLPHGHRGNKFIARRFRAYETCRRQGRGICGTSCTRRWWPSSTKPLLPACYLTKFPLGGHDGRFGSLVCGARGVACLPVNTHYLPSCRPVSQSPIQPLVTQVDRLKLLARSTCLNCHACSCFRSARV